MFDLDVAISEWRRRMLAAGIKKPAPLEELEIHLRDETEWHMKSGLNEAEAFKAAVEKIGDARLLRKEFKKVENNHKVMRAVLLIIGWLAAGDTLYCGTSLLQFDWDFFGFSPKWNLAGIVDVLMILVAVAGSWFLAKASRGKASCAVSLLACAFLAWFALVHVYPPEKPIVILWASTHPSPFWFRGGLTLLLCAPGIFWVGWIWRHLARQHGLKKGSQPILQDAPC